MRAFAYFCWTVLILALLAGIVAGIWYLVAEHNAGERSKNDQCAREGGNGRVYVKYGKGGFDAEAGTYCVKIIYKE
jgi:hypothetical protein